MMTEADSNGTMDEDGNLLSNSSQKGIENTKKSCICCPKTTKMRIILGTTILILVGVSAVTVGCVLRNPAIFMYPLHASCNITWTFGKECNEVANILVKQIDVWKTNETCGTGQKCLYELVSIEGNLLKATHTTPKARYIDDLTYTFYPNQSNGGCNVVGFSTSRLWYALLDYGTNYCNLHNLVDGAGLRSDKLYTELTRDEVCTQYTSSNCEKY